MRVILVDFDGVINSYISGFTNDSDIPDPPIDGAQDYIARLRRQYRVVVFSTRARTTEGTAAVKGWLSKYSIETDGITAIKIPCWLMIDDRAINFGGKWDSEMLKKIDEFQTWQDSAAESREKMVPESDLKDPLKGLFDPEPQEPINQDLI